MTTAERYCQLVPFCKGIGDDLGLPPKGMSSRRLFVLVMLFDLEQASMAQIRDAARDKEIRAYLRERLDDSVAHSVRRLQHRRNIRALLAELRALGLIASVKDGTGRRTTYHLSDRARSCLKDYSYEAQLLHQQIAIGPVTKRCVASCVPNQCRWTV